MYTVRIAHAAAHWHFLRTEAGKDIQPWHVGYRQNYAINADRIDERWRDTILARRSRNNIEKAAMRGCFRSSLEATHLKGMD